MLILKKRSLCSSLRVLKSAMKCKGNIRLLAKQKFLPVETILQELVLNNKKIARGTRFFLFIQLVCHYIKKTEKDKMGMIRSLVNDMVIFGI